MGEYRYRENVKRGMAFVLAIILGGMAFLPGFPVFPVKAAPASGQQTTLTTAHGDTLLGHKLYCIDKGGYAIWGIAEKGDLYEAHRPSQASVPLSNRYSSNTSLPLPSDASMGMAQVPPPSIPSACSPMQFGSLL